MTECEMEKLWKNGVFAYFKLPYQSVFLFRKCLQEATISPYLNHTHPVHTFPYYSPQIHSFSHLRLVLPSGSLPSDFPTKILYAFLVCYMTRPHRFP